MVGIKFMLTPGPTEVSPEVLSVMSKPVLHHRDPEFVSLAKECLKNAQKIFQTNNSVLILPSTGTYAMEMCAASIIEKGTKVIAINTGLFGKRFKEMLQIYGAKIIEISAEPGKGVDPDEVGKVLHSERDIKAIAMVHCETSTGAVNAVKDIVKEAKNHGVITMIDAVSSLGGMDIKTDDWGIDLLFTASQKCLGCPPGLSLLSVSDDAYEFVKKRKEPVKSWSFNIVEWKNHLARDFPFRITPPVTLFYALHKSMQLILEEGLANVFKRHEEVARFIRGGIKDLGLELFTDEKYLSNTITCFKVPKNLPSKSLIEELIQKWGIRVSDGLGDLKGKIIRIAHMGNTATMVHSRAIITALKSILTTT